MLKDFYTLDSVLSRTALILFQCFPSCSRNKARCKVFCVWHLSNTVLFIYQTPYFCFVYQNVLSTKIMVFALSTKTPCLQNALFMLYLPNALSTKRLVYDLSTMIHNKFAFCFNNQMLCFCCVYLTRLYLANALLLQG